MAQTSFLPALTALLLGILGAVPTAAKLYASDAVSAPVISSISAQASEDRAIDDTDGAISFITSLSAETVAVWSDERMTADERDSAAKALFLKAVDIDLLARAMLGRHFRRATAAQRSEYLEVMTAYIVGAFDKRMRQIGFRDLDVVGTSPAPGKRGHVFVKTMVERDEGAPIIADWRVKKTDGVFKIVNLEIEGINLLITNREYFAERIKTLGGVDAFIAELREEISKG